MPQSVSYEQEILNSSDPDVTVVKIKNSVSASTPDYYVYKACINPEKYDDFYKLFQNEFQHLHNITDTGCYHLFPRYETWGKNQLNQPFIVSEYVKGITLEAYLIKQSSGNVPQKILSKTQMLHLFEQLDRAFTLLSGNQILYLDLSPKNIILTNEETFDITLIDFTDVYYQNKKYQVRPPKAIDQNITRKYPPEKQLAEASSFLFTRLFYHGHKEYLQYAKLGERNSVSYQSFFSSFAHMNFSNILFCLNNPSFFEDESSDLLFYWKKWYENFKDIVEEYY